jgi:transposase InsO family protein
MLLYYFGTQTLEENKIKHIKARVNHPQTNGKFEKWNDTYELNRFRFENFDNFMNWYNTVRFHESLDTMVSTDARYRILVKAARRM